MNIIQALSTIILAIIFHRLNKLEDHSITTYALLMKILERKNGK